MFAAHFFQQVNHWFAPLSRLSQPASAAAAAGQIIVQPGDSYFLAAGAYQVRVLTGRLWLPEQGILTAGAQVELCADWRGVELRPATARPVVFTVDPQI